MFLSGSLGLARPGVDFAHLLVDSFDTHADLLKEAIDLLFRARRRIAKQIEDRLAAALRDAA